MSEPCDYCGGDPDEDGCVCHLAPDFPNDPILELDTDYLDWDYYDEEDDNDESNGQENLGEAEAN